MNYCNITYPDINNGLGCRVTLWVSGCPHHCPGCHNSETWPREFGRKWTSESFEELRKDLDRDYIKGLTLSGGEPLDLTDESKLSNILKIVNKFRDLYGSSKDIWVYSGYTLPVLLEHPIASEILSKVDVIVDGPFLIDRRDTSLAFRGSGNQRIHRRLPGTTEFVDCSDEI